MTNLTMDETVRSSSKLTLNKIKLSAMGVGDEEKDTEGRKSIVGFEFECYHCKRQLKTEDELSKHVAESHGKLKELFKCIVCAKHFGNRHILQLHLQVHEANDRGLSTSEADITKLASKVVESDVGDTEARQKRLLLESPPPAKKVGLTKIRLEDCLRCDACSCIYLDDSDYHKHMRNFHRETLKKQKQKKQCRSCCKHCKCNGDHQQKSEPATTTNHLHFNIKDRWRKIVSTRLDCEKIPTQVKTESDSVISDDTVDYSHLLSQVEVRIKTEPIDDMEYMEQLHV